MDETADMEAVMYDLERLHEFLREFEETPRLRERVVDLVDYAAWEQIVTSMRGLRSTVRNVEGQVRRLRSGT